MEDNLKNLSSDTVSLVREIPSNHSMNITNMILGNVAQHDDIQEVLNGEENHYTDEGKGSSDDNIDLLAEHDYWEDCVHINKKQQQHQPKRKSRKQLEMAAYQKTIARKPSYYHFDLSTTHLLEMLRTIGITGDYHSIIGYGKHSVVIHADSPDYANPWYRDGVAVKVYRLTNDIKHNNAMFNRVKREHDRLLTTKNKRVACVPDFVYRHKNVIVTQFLGSDQETAPSIATEKLLARYQTMVQILYEFYNIAQVVHGKLSVKNILYYYDYFHFIGWAHSVTKDHPIANKKLMRDCYFITQFFKEQGGPVVTKETLFKKVTGLPNINRKILDAIPGRDLWQKQHLVNPNRKSSESNNKSGSNCRFKQEQFVK